MSKNADHGQDYSDKTYSLENCKQEFIADLKDVAKRREGLDKLIRFLEKKSDFFRAPACANGLGSYEGGLVRNSLNIMNRMFQDIGGDQIARGLGADLSADLVDSVMIISHLSGIWKANYFQPVMKKKTDEKGNEVEYVAGYRPKPVDERLCFGRDDDHGDEAVYMIQGFISLSRDEALAIRSQDWNPNSIEGSRILAKCPLATYFHTAMLKARYIDEKKVVF